jgi:hypothetical protein
MVTWAGPDRLFVGRDDRPMRGDAIRQAFNRARPKAGMPGFRFHDYADVSVMPTSARSCCSEAVNARRLSA